MSEQSVVAPGGDRAPGANRASVGFIFVTLFLDVLGFGLLIPVAPKLIQKLLGEHVGTDVTGWVEAASGEASPYYGALVATYAAMQLVFAPILGGLSDRFGRRPLLLLSMLGSGLDYFAMALSPNLAFLFVTRALNGISGASMTVCSAYIADVTPPDKRAGAFGMMGAAFGIGFVVGPAAGGALGNIDIHLPFYAAGALSIMNWMYGYFVLPESVPVERRVGFKGISEGPWRWAWHVLREATPVRAVSHLRRYPLVAGMALSTFVMGMAMFGLHATWALYTAKRYGWDPLHVGLSLTAVGVGAAIVQGGLAKKVIPAMGLGMVGERRALIFGGAVASLAYVGYGLATEGWMIYAIVLIVSIGGIAQPAAQALITRTVKPHEQGLIQGAMTSVQCVAQVFGPLLATFIYKYAVADGTPSPLNHPGLSFFVGAGFAVVGVLAAAYATRGVTPVPTRRA